MHKNKSKFSPTSSATTTPVRGSKVPVDLPLVAAEVPVAEAREVPVPEARAAQSLDEDATIRAPLEKCWPLTPCPLEAKLGFERQSITEKQRQKQTQQQKGNTAPEHT